MQLKEVRISAPVKVRDCHLQFKGEQGPDQYRRRAHLLEQVAPDRIENEPKFSDKAIYHLAEETTFKAGEVIFTDFEFPKSMRDKARYADDVDDAESEAEPASSSGRGRRPKAAAADK